MNELTLYEPLSALMQREIIADSECRALDKRIAQEVYGLRVFKIQIKGEWFYYAVSDAVIKERGATPFDVGDHEHYLKFYSSDLELAFQLANKVLDQMSTRQSTEHNQKNGTWTTGYGAVMNLQLVSLPNGGVKNTQVDFVEIGKLGPMETTKRVGVGVDIPKAICSAALEAWVSKKDFKFPDKEIKDVTPHMRHLLSGDIG